MRQSKVALYYMPTFAVIALVFAKPDERSSFKGQWSQGRTVSSGALCVTLSPSFQTTYPSFPMTIASDAVGPFSTVTNYVSINSPAVTGYVKKDSNGARSVPPLPSASSSRRTECVEL